MRISDWSSDVCSSDVLGRPVGLEVGDGIHTIESIDDEGIGTKATGQGIVTGTTVDEVGAVRALDVVRTAHAVQEVPEAVADDDVGQVVAGDRKSVGEGKRGVVRVDFGGGRII